MRQQWRRWGAILGLGAMMAVAGPSPQSLSTGEALAKPGATQVAPVTSKPQGESYSTWAARWWQWAMSIPAASNPVADETGAFCGEGQDGPVWFLAGTFGGPVTRTCTIPRGKSLFFPVANSVWYTVVGDPLMELDELHDLLWEFLGTVHMTVTIDGAPVKKLDSYAVESDGFSAHFPAEDNAFGLVEETCADADGDGTPDDPDCATCVDGDGDGYLDCYSCYDVDGDGMLDCSPAADVGYYLFVRPLASGVHHIRIKASTTSGFALDVTYRLLVLSK